MAVKQDMLDAIDLVNVLKKVVDFVSDDAKVQKFYAQVGDIQKIQDDLDATIAKNTETMRALNDMKDIASINDVAKRDLDQRTKAVTDLEAKIEQDRRIVATATLATTSALKAAMNEKDLAEQAHQEASADRKEAEELLNNAQVKSDQLDKAIADYKAKLAKLSDEA